MDVGRLRGLLSPRNLKCSTRGGNIITKLSHQGLDAIEALLRTQTLNEPNRKPFTIEIVIEVEQMCLDERTIGDRVKGRPAADVNRARMFGAIVSTAHGRIDAILWHEESLPHIDICGGKPDGPAALIATDDIPSDFDWSTEHLGRVVKSPIGDGEANRGRRDHRGTIQRAELDRQHGEVVMCPHGGQHRHIPLPLSAEVKIFTNDDSAGSECVDEHPTNKVIGCLACGGRIERQHHNRINTGQLKQLEPLREVGQ
jgi:hypothetical protein